jgi:molybdopterin/thiamine biosynthesis adenylyltransferase/rhodanese-related sulfurtransferase
MADDPIRIFSQPELLRYARHLVLPEVGVEGQVRLKRARVLLVGAGGLGSPAAMYLAAAGVGTLGLVDFDVVDASNLQRQLLHGESDLGRPKLESARDRLREINPHVEVILHPARISSENALGILEPYDLVVDGSDNFPTRYLVNDACILLGKPLVYGAVLRWEGQVSVFGLPGGPCYRCLFREPPPPGAVPSCAEGGVLGVLPGIIGSLQALEALKLIMGTGEGLSGRFVIFDAMEMRFRELKLGRNPECPVCGDHPTQSALIDYEIFCGVEPTAGPDSGGLADGEDGADPEIPEITATELRDRLEAGDPPLLLDVREPYEWGIASLEDRGAVQVPMAELAPRLPELPRDRAIVVICRSGARSATVTRTLVDAGFQDVRNLKGGLLAWSEQVDPTMARY